MLFVSIGGGFPEFEAGIFLVISGDTISASDSIYLGLEIKQNWAILGSWMG